MNELALFAGAGGGILGGKLLGWRTVCAVECDAYAASVLVARQNDGMLEPFPIWDDVRTFDGLPWRGAVDVVSGGFPCQDISAAGRGAGIEGERSGLWSEMARIIGEIRPRFAFVENSPMLTVRGLGRVLGDLAAMGYDSEWGVLGAHHVGAPHRRDRIWIVAHAGGTGRQRDEHDGYAGKRSVRGSAGESCKNVGNTDKSGWKGSDDHSKFPGGIQHVSGESSEDMANAIGERQQGSREPWFSGDPAEVGERETDHAFNERLSRIWGIESRVGRVAHGVANRVDRLLAIGNGQVPSVAALAWGVLSKRLLDSAI